MHSTKSPELGQMTMAKLLFDYDPCVSTIISMDFENYDSSGSTTYNAQNAGRDSLCMYAMQYTYMYK